MENDAYSIKELVNMIYELKIELAKTQTLIQKYNGLREKQTRYESAQDEIDLRLKTVEDCLCSKILFFTNSISFKLSLSFISNIKSLILVNDLCIISIFLTKLGKK